LQYEENAQAQISGAMAENVSFVGAALRLQCSAQASAYQFSRFGQEAPSLDLDDSKRSAGSFIISDVRYLLAAGSKKELQEEY
jgi:hypothetical protein